MNSKELIKVKQNIFTKIKDFFRSIFVRNHKDVMLNASNTISTQHSSINNSQKEQFLIYIIILKMVRLMFSM